MSPLLLVSAVTVDGGVVRANGVRFGGASVLGTSMDIRFFNQMKFLLF